MIILVDDGRWAYVNRFCNECLFVDKKVVVVVVSEEMSGGRGAEVEQ